MYCLAVLEIRSLKSGVGRPWSLCREREGSVLGLSPIFQTFFDLFLGFWKFLGFLDNSNLHASFLLCACLFLIWPSSWHRCDLILTHCICDGPLPKGGHSVVGPRWAWTPSISHCSACHTSARCDFPFFRMFGKREYDNIYLTSKWYLNKMYHPIMFDTFFYTRYLWVKRVSLNGLELNLRVEFWLWSHPSHRLRYTLSLKHGDRQGLRHQPSRWAGLLPEPGAQSPHALSFPSPAFVSSIKSLAIQKPLCIPLLIKLYFWVHFPKTLN